MALELQKLLGIGSVQNVQGVTNPSRISRTPNSFVKDTFNYGKANPNQPYGVVEENALGMPTKGTKLYCLG